MSVLFMQFSPNPPVTSHLVSKYSPKHSAYIREGKTKYSGHKYIRQSQNLFWYQFWLFLTVVSKYFNYATVSKDFLATFMLLFCPAFWWGGIRGCIQIFWTKS